MLVAIVGWRRSFDFPPVSPEIFGLFSGWTHGCLPAVSRGAHLIVERMGNALPRLFVSVLCSTWVGWMDKDPLLYVLVPASV